MDLANTFRDAIEAGDVVLGARSTTFSPTVIERFGLLGVDFIWLDFEHSGPSPYDSTCFEDLTRAAESGGTELLVRLPSGDPSLVRKVLDAGVRNLLIPRVDSPEEVRAAVRASRFVYEGEPGERGMASGRSRGWGTRSRDEYVRAEDETVCVGVMIEKQSAVESLEEILSIPGLGFVFIGPSDLAVQLGHPTDKTHPEVRETIRSIEEATREAGVPLGGVAHDPGVAAEKVGSGYQIVRLGGDLEAATSGIEARLNHVRSESR